MAPVAFASAVPAARPRCARRMRAMRRHITTAQTPHRAGPARQGPSMNALRGLVRDVSGMEEFDAQLPSGEVVCACGSTKEYGKCCRAMHTAARSARMAEELLRSRYSAYAYKLPAYIMRTTAAGQREFDRRRWRSEIGTFCKQYQFDGGVEVLETTMTGPTSTTIVFRANLVERGTVVSFVEMSKFVKEQGTWYYESGKLVGVENV